MELPQSSNLKIESLSQLFGNKSECYKFFWFQAVIIKVLENRMDLTFEELIDEMIVEAWYMVTEYHLNLGPRDTLEMLVHHIQDLSGLQSTAKKEEILDFVRKCTDKEVLNMKKTLTHDVPYRLQAPFMNSSVFANSRQTMIALINQQPGLIYYFGSLNGLQTHIFIQDGWYDYFRKNQEILKGWLRYNMIVYLQRRNPSVPRIADKLFPQGQRDLDDAKKFWKTLYFVKFAHIEFFSYEKIYQDEEVRRKFNKCEKKYLNDQDIERRLYREGQVFTALANQLEEVVHPVYQSAANCGFTPWIYHGETNGSND